TEPDTAIAQVGKVCLQIHSGPPGEAWYRTIRIRALAPRPEGPIATPSPDVQFRRHQITPEFLSEAISAADVDRDGDMDLIAGAFWFEAPGWQRHALSPARTYSIHDGYSDTFVSYPLDVDQDGWTDVVSFDFPGRGTYWYRNPGDAAGQWDRFAVHPAVRSESPLGEDVDGDGRLDLLFVDAAAGQVVWLSPPDTPGDTAWTRHEIDPAMSPDRSGGLAHGMGFGDVNGDDRPDAITIDAWWEAPTDPRGTWTEHPADFGEPAAQMYALDADGDGDADVFGSSAHAYGIWWYEQKRADDGSVAWETHTIDDRLSQTHALAVADLNGDGLPDLITGSRFFAHNGNDPGEFDPTLLVWYEASRDASGHPVWIPRIIDGDAGVGLQIVVQDVIGDERPDILTASKKGVYVFERVGTGE
ncbi:MAG TPA: FG-GAP and VCBS repeat-containing protein, partial [Rhodothermales bacterium]